jgi:RNA polymerase sigma factor (sigma-70 family)
MARSEKFTVSSSPALLECTDHDLIQSCLNGEESAWKVLVERYSRLVYSIPLRWGLSTEDADDVFQNVFTIVFRQLERLRNQTVLPAWLITITHRETMRIRKRLARNGKIFESSALMETLSPSDTDTWVRQHYVHQALSRLDPEGQRLLTALFLDPASPSYKEVAAHLGLPEGSIGPMRARYFKKLESILAEMDSDI